MHTSWPGNGGRPKKGYLAQHQLFEQVPALAHDILQPEYCALGEGLLQSVNAWLGPAGTVRPPHNICHWDRTTSTWMLR